MITTVLSNGFLSGPHAQIPTGTNQFFDWYFYGLGGLGGWLIFLLLAMIAVVWLLYDSQKRHLPATGWRIGIFLLTLLVLPTILYRFTVTPVHYGIYQILTLYEEDCPIDVITQNYPEVSVIDCDQLSRSLPPLTPYGEYVFFLGLIGGILAPVLAVGYYVTFQGMVGCPQGHVYETVLGQCPDCAAEQRAREPERGYVGMPAPVPEPQPSPPRREATPPRPSKPTLQYAWLMDLTNNHRHDLYEGITLIGRSPENDIYLNDQAVSRRHVQIRESHGHCTLSDIGSKSGTLLNGQKLRTPRVMQNGDEITLGDTVFKFVSSR